MARSQSATARTTRDPTLSHDRFVDTSYIKVNSSEEKYLEAPWYHYKNPLASYLSLRFAEKDGFREILEDVSTDDWNRVVHEIERVNLDRQNQCKTPSPCICQPKIFDFLSTVHPSQAPEVHGADDPYHGFRAGAMYFKKRIDGTLDGITSSNEKYSNEKYKPTKFPNQKIALADILDNADGNPLSEKRPDGEVRYFHFPSNNMEWIEKAISQYYSRRNGPNGPAKDVQRLLSREYWTGQMHGGGPVDTVSDARRTAPVHSRHMRSKCSLVPREIRPKFSTSKSTSHIQTASSPRSAPQRAMSISVPIAEKNVAIFLPYLHWETSSRRAEMVKVINEATGADSNTRRKRLLLSQAVHKALEMKKSKNEANIKNKTPRLERKQHLARYLFAAARMAEEIDYAADEKLLREKVNTHPPLHVRRTLDQYYFLTLDNTSERDRDQVVYRGTRSLSSTTRVVMVDQLWMWILDDNTIITSFPRRWGRNKPDPSGVHKSLRDRLGQKTEVIKSIHHLAMIIMDQCSRVFFDRTRPLDQRPEVMDLFAAAIGTVTEKTRIAYDHFWRAIAQDQHYNGQLVINPEGIVLKEAQDIVEELMIMKRVYCEQLKVAKEFMRHLTHPHGRHAAMSGDALLINKFISELKKTMAKDTEDDDHEPLDLETRIDEESVHEAHDLIELLHARLEEITDLEEAAMRACTQLEGLLSLKQQQASIIDARAALDTANESYKQGRTIQAFTIVTIVFLPLGFIAAFFGMNNVEINDAPWMSLWQQIKWMFGGTAVVIFVSISLAFGSWFRDLSAWVRAVLRFALQVPWAKFSQGTEITIVHDWWKSSLFNSKNLDRKRESLLADIAKKRREKEYISQQKLLEDHKQQTMTEMQDEVEGEEGDGHMLGDLDVGYKQRILQQMRSARLVRKADDMPNV
ncbi:hypothetical protein G7054_g6956 [Neopestalotiopsis clavispora]|nr:hypothetical protein G7054_g6956 [Neopestalotiopsis clavispora]